MEINKQMGFCIILFLFSRGQNVKASINLFYFFRCVSSLPDDKSAWIYPNRIMKNLNVFAKFEIKI